MEGIASYKAEQSLKKTHLELPASGQTGRWHKEELSGTRDLVIRKSVL